MTIGKHENLDEATKRCVGKCGRRLPLTKENFRVWTDRRYKNPCYASKCNDCVRLEKKLKAREEYKARKEKAQGKSVGFTDPVVRAFLCGGGS